MRKFMKNSCRYNMDRGWKFTEQQCTVLPQVLSHENVYGFSKTGGAFGPAADSYIEKEWKDVDLPHDWQHYLERDRSAAADHGYYKGGTGWYRRRFFLDEADRDKAITLVFDGIGGRARVYLNGVEAAANESRYNSFCVNITDIANYGSVPNTLAVEVDSRKWEGWWYEGSGIYRHVWLLKEPRIHARYNGIYVRPEKKETSDAWNTYVELELVNDRAGRGTCKSVVKIVDEAGETIAAPIEDSAELDGFETSVKKYCFHISGVKLWNVDDPALYRLQISLDTDGDMQELEIPFGYRTIRVDPDTGFWLNGKNVKLLGVCCHQDHAGVGAAVPDTIAEYRISRLKEMGCNAYRCVHHNPAPELLDICDRMGMLVMDENRVFNSSDNGLKLLTDMVKRDRNHPSVIMYSVFNEEPLQGTLKGRNIARRMVKELKKWDDTRPVLGAFNGGFMEHQGAADVFDVTGINYFMDSYDDFHKEYPGQPLVSSELVSAFGTRGAAAEDRAVQEFDNFDTCHAPWGESVREANREVMKRPFVMGMFVWTGFDYRGEPTPYEWPSVNSHFGIMDMCGFPKDTYYLYQSYWKEEKVLHLFPHWNHSPGDVVKVMAYSNCEEVELFVNGSGCGRKKNDPYEQCSWEVEYMPGKIEAVGYYSDGTTVRAERRTAGKPAALKLESPNSAAYRDTKDAVILNITAVDEEGQEAPAASGLIRIRAEGGELLGMGNGDPNCHVPDKAEEYPLFYGKCQAVVRAGQEAGSLCVYVESDDYPCEKYTWKITERETEPEVPEADITVIGNWKVSHQIWDEKPDPGMKLLDSDMNSMEPIEFNDMPLPQLRGKKNKYVLYKTRVKLPESTGNYQIRFVKCAGEMEVYWDGEMIGSQNHLMTGEMAVPLPESCVSEGSLTVILKNTVLDECAGIMGSVELSAV